MVTSLKVKGAATQFMKESIINIALLDFLGDTRVEMHLIMWCRAKATFQQVANLELVDK